MEKGVKGGGRHRTEMKKGVKKGDSGEKKEAWTMEKQGWGRVDKEVGKRVELKRTDEHVWEFVKMGNTWKREGEELGRKAGNKGERGAIRGATGGAKGEGTREKRGGK